MNDPIFLTPTFAVAGAIDENDLADIRARGFTHIINNRPDGEADGQVEAATMRAAAEAAGFGYSFVPANKLELFCDHVVEGMAQAAKQSDGPVLAHCLSGMRSAIVWAAAEARHRPVDDILADLTKAGFELDFLRDELDTQAAHQLARSTVSDDKPAAASGNQRAA